MNNTDTVYWSSVPPHHEWNIYAAATKAGLCCVTLPNESFETMDKLVKRHFPHSSLVQNEDWMFPYVRELEEYFEGNRREFSLALDFRGTPFQVSVWDALLKIPYGQSVTYSDVARSIGKPAAVRAVGAAIGANPIPFIVPCHRVLGKNGSLTGYRGGMDIKSALLQLESTASATNTVM